MDRKQGLFVKPNNRSQIHGLPRRLILMIFWLSVIFVVIQFVKLATVGRIGIQISELKNQQEEYELSNELLRSEISELLSNSNIEAALETDERLESKKIHVISVLNELANEDIIAQR